MNKNQKSILLVAEWPEPRFLRGVARYAREASWHLSLESIYGNCLPWGWKGDGCLASCFLKEYADFSASLDMPVLDLFCPQEGRTYPTICEDNHAIGCMGADYLCERQFRHLAVYRMADEPFTVERMEGFTRRLEEKGFQAEDLFWNDDEQSGRENWHARKTWLLRKLKALPKPAGIFCIDDRMAVSVIEVCVEAGIDVPHEISVLGVGDMELAGDYSPVPLTSISIDFEAFGYRAAAMLGDMLEGKQLPEQHVRIAPAGIKERISTSTFALTHPDGQVAMRCLLERAFEPVTPSDVAGCPPAIFPKSAAPNWASVHRSCWSSSGSAKPCSSCWKRIIPSTVLPLPAG